MLDDVLEIAPNTNKYNINSIKAINSSGRTILIPKYECLPPYIEKCEPYEIKRPIPDTITKGTISDVGTCDLLAKYVPKSYRDLITDEASNKEVLMWMRYWQNKKKDDNETNSDKSSRKKGRVSKLSDLKSNLNSNETKVINYSHILLLQGHPGSGKTTLIKVIAHICGYHTVEFNASEDPNSERNQLLMTNQLNFLPSFGIRTKPLLVFEELDGIGSMSVPTINSILRMKDRPCVVIVNDAYTPNLRTLRSVSKFVRMRPTEPYKIVDRLKEICTSENIVIDDFALNLIVQQSNLDIRTAINTIRFLVLKQPITAQVVKMMPVGHKNSNLSPIDVLQSLFDPATTFNEMYSKLEIFGGTSLVSTGVLENIENLKTYDPTREKLCAILDNLSFADMMGSECFYALASIPRLITQTRPLKFVRFPVESIEYESNARKNLLQCSKLVDFKNNLDIYRFYLAPPKDVLDHLMSSVGKDDISKFAIIHKLLKLSYKKNSFGHYTSEPDIDTILKIKGNPSTDFAKYREMITQELDKAALRKRSHVKNYTDELSNNKGSMGPIRNFWGEIIEYIPNQETPLYSINYVYNEGTTNAVRRKVPLQRILLVQ